MPSSLSILMQHRPQGPNLVRRGWGVLLCGTLVLAPAGVARAQTTTPAATEKVGPLTETMLDSYGLDPSYNMSAGANDLAAAFDLFQREQYKDALDALIDASHAANLGKKPLPRGEVLMARLWFATQHPLVCRYTLELDATKRGVSRWHALELQGHEAYERRDYKWALWCYETVASENPGEQGFAFNVARVYEKLGQLDRAHKIMLALAPAKRREGDPIGLPKAHLWLAMYMLKNPSLGPTEQADLETHLIRAATATTTDEETKLNAYALLGQLCLATAQNDLHRLNEAEQHFKQVVDDKPELLIPLARVHILLAYTSSNNEATRRSNLEQARSDALRAEAYFRKRVNNDVDDVEARLNLAEAELFLEKSDDAIGLLKTGLKCVPTDSPDVARLMALLGRSHFLASEMRYRNIELRRRDLDDPMRGDEDKALIAIWERERREHLVEAFRSDPRHMPMLHRVMIGLQAGSPEHDFMADLLGRLIDDDDVPRSIVELLMAVDHWNRRESEQALVQLRDALARDAQIPSLLIDMARFCVKLPPPDPQQSLDLLNMGRQAWADKPDMPYLADLYTERGVLWIKAGEFDRARSDLERALTLRPRDSRAAKPLVTVYRKLGLSEEADQLNQEMQGFPMATGR